MLAHPKTTHVLYAYLVNHDEPGFERLSSTSSSTISASTRHGSVRRTVPSGVNSWRQLCPVKDAPPDDDDEQEWLAWLVQYVQQRLQYLENFLSGCTYIRQFMAIWNPGVCTSWYFISHPGQLRLVVTVYIVDKMSTGGCHNESWEETSSFT